MKKFIIVWILFTVISLSMGWTCLAGEKSSFPKSQNQPDLQKKLSQNYDLPRDEVQEYRALIAETRAIRAEAALALKEIEDRRIAIYEKWKLLTKETDLESWEIDIVEGKIKKKAISK